MTALASRPLVRQFSGLSAARIAAAALSFVWFAVATRQLDVPEVADLTLLLSVGAMLGVISDWGYVVVLNETVARDPSSGRPAFVLALRRRLTLAPLSVAGTAVLYLLVARERSLAVVAAYGVSVVASIVYTTATAALRGAGTVGPDAANEVGSRIVMLVVGALLVTNGAGLLAVVVAYAAVDVISAVVLARLAWQRLAHTDVVDPQAFASSRLLPLGLAALVGLVYYRIDVWLLALLADASEVARYSVCYRLLDGVTIPAGVLAALVIGSTADLDLSTARRKVDRMALTLSAAMAPLAIAFVAVPGPILRLAFGPGYADAAPVLRLLGLAVVPTVCAAAWAPLAGLRGHRLVRTTVISLAGNLALNLVLVPSMGGTGAAIATVAGQVTFAALLRASLVERTPR